MFGKKKKKLNSSSFNFMNSPEYIEGIKLMTNAFKSGPDKNSKIKYIDKMVKYKGEEK